MLTRFRAQLPRMGVGITCLLVTNGLGLAIPWVLKHAIDALATHGAGAQALVVRDALLIAVFAVVQAVFRTASRILIFNAGRNLEFDLRRDLFDQLLRQAPSYYRERRTGDVMSRLTNDLGAVRMLFGPGILNLANTAIVYVTGLGLMFGLSTRLTLAALLPFPLLILAGRSFTRKLQQKTRELQDELGHLTARLSEDLGGIQLIKLHALEAQRQAAFAAASDTYLRKSMDLVGTRGALMPLFAALGGLGTLAVLWVGGREVIAGHMTVGELVAFNAYLMYLVWPTIAFGWILSLWQRGVAAWARIREILDASPTIADTPGARDETPPDGRIEVRDLTVSAGGRKLLDRVSFEVPAGSAVALVGPTGSGKTTLADALVHLVEIPAGAVFIGGRDVAGTTLAALRRAVGYAPQDGILLSATLAENIHLDRPAPGGAAANLERVRWAAEAAGLGRDLATFPAGLETLVGERGITLSGGQRQRVALARALYGEPQVLVLDDSLASVDAATEREILDRLRPILRGRTSVLVSHRLTAIKDADLILVLDGGRLVERGRHDELVAKGGVYAGLYREQLAASSGEST